MEYPGTFRFRFWVNLEIAHDNGSVLGTFSGERWDVVEAPLQEGKIYKHVMASPSWTDLKELEIAYKHYKLLRKYNLA